MFLVANIKIIRCIYTSQCSETQKANLFPRNSTSDPDFEAKPILFSPMTPQKKGPYQQYSSL